MFFRNCVAVLFRFSDRKRTPFRICDSVRLRFRIELLNSVRVSERVLVVIHFAVGVRLLDNLSDWLSKRVFVGVRVCNGNVVVIRDSESVCAEFDVPLLVSQRV